jgi:hypothetical protein
VVGPVEGQRVVHEHLQHPVAPPHRQHAVLPRVADGQPVEEVQVDTVDVQTLHVEVAELLGERLRNLRWARRVELDEELSDEPPAARLLGERRLHGALAEHALLDEDLAESRTVEHG